MATSSVEDRGGVRGKDWFVRCYVIHGAIELILHTTSEFLCNEDV